MAKRTAGKSTSKRVTTRSRAKNGRGKLGRLKSNHALTVGFEESKNGQKRKIFLEKLKALSSFY